jgi:hypothetical protein
MKRYIGKIPEQDRQDDIKWLVIEPHVHNNPIVGYYMYYHEELHLPAKWDNW